MKKLAIFDFDGTLADSMEIWQRACSMLLKNEGITPPEGIDQLLLPMSVTQTCQYLVDNFLPDITLEEMLKKTDDIIFDWYAEGVLLKPGAKEYLQALKDAGVTLCVLSSTQRLHLIRAAKRLGIQEYFAHIWGGTDTPEGKDDPMVFGWAANHFGLTCSDCVVFEDSLYAVKSANIAGCKTVAIDDLYTRHDQSEIMSLCDVYLYGFDPKTALSDIE